ncbi:MAG: hypothetical protein ACN6O3_15580 [Comamonas sp.]
MNPNPPTTPAPADPLVQLYREATAEDRGPAEATRERVLEYAAAQARQRHTPSPAANDGRWLRQALAGIAAIGVVGVLVLQHGQQAETESGSAGPAAELAAPPADVPAPAAAPAARSSAAGAPAARSPAATSAPAAKERARAVAPVAQPQAAAPAEATRDCAAADAQQAKRADAHSPRPSAEQDCTPPEDGTQTPQKKDQ